jgi:DEAD/DEAH box helicase domain-containing protein
MPPAARDVVDALREDRAFGPQLVEALYLSPRVEKFGELEPSLPEPIVSALAAAGIQRLWRHQAEGLAAVRRRENVLVTTPTASGKSLVFHVPVLEEAVRERPGRALFLYPLKALGQDQRAKLEALSLNLGIDGDLCGIYDGDTPEKERARIKRSFPRVVISNPDMLHLGILGFWQTWEPFLKELRWIVLDELHAYRGIFGSHFHHVLQRLLRLCRTGGVGPVVIASSATAVNAGEFAESLVGRPFRWIVDSGAPQPGRHFLLFRPAASPYTLTLTLLIELLKKRQKTIVFTKARRITELLYSWLRRQEPQLAERVASYRSGFLPGERRQIERDLFEGSLDGVISTSALEMGIDVGGLDACILVGFPGSVMATWQRSGRVGRGDRESITALVPLPDALDQYFLEHPRELVERPCEQLIVDPANEPVSRAHLVCAGAELPLSRERDRDYLARHVAVVGELLREKLLRESKDGTELLATYGRPHSEVSLRGAGETSTILEVSSGRVVGTVDGVRVLHECHPGAVYLHWGRQFLVRELDLSAKKVLAEPVSLDYYTSPLTEKETEILGVLDETRDGALQAFIGRLRVTEKVVGYERRQVRGQEAIDQHVLDLPPVSYETVGLWWVAPREVEERLRAEELHFMGSLHASEHAAISLMPLYTLCDRGDIGGISIPLHPQVQTGCVFIYDGHPGGVGIAARAFEQLPELLGRVVDLVADCDCDEGCPSCVQSPKCGNGNRPLDKAGAELFLKLLLGREPLLRDEDRFVSRVSIEGPREKGQPSPALRAASCRETEGGAVEERTLPLETPIPVPRLPKRTMLFDLETQRSAGEVGGWRNAHKMLVAVGAVCHLEAGRIEIFREEEVLQMITLLETADAVIGFNILRFDYPVLAGYTGIDYSLKWPTLDLLAELQRRLGFRPRLDDLAGETLGIEKSADGLCSLEWVKQGRLDLVEEYCRRDVEIARDLYLFGRRMGHVIVRDREGERIEVPVDW